MYFSYNATTVCDTIKSAEESLKGRVSAGLLVLKAYKNVHDGKTVWYKANNRAKSKVIGRVEYVFGFKIQSMLGLFVRSVAIRRAKANTALTSHMYN